MAKNEGKNTEIKNRKLYINNMNDNDVISENNIEFNEGFTPTTVRNYDSNSNKEYIMSKFNSIFA